MKCPRCKRRIKNSSNYCYICGKKIIRETNNENNCKRNNFYLIIIAILLLVVLLETCFFLKNNKSNNSNCSNECNCSEPKEDIEEKIYTYNETFNFDDYEITIKDNYSFVVIDNVYSDYNGQTVVMLPLTIKNNSDNARNFDIYNYDIYSFQDRMVNNASSYFAQSLDHGAILEPNETYTRYFYFIYEGKGKYLIRFNNNIENVTVEIEIN